MTPFAVLLAKRTDSDDVIRKLYHRIAEANHPDRNPKKRGTPGPQWYDATEAYTAIKTLPARTEWLRRQSLRAGLCRPCDGLGVTGTRIGKGSVKVCSTCNGEGTASRN